MLNTTSLEQKSTTNIIYAGFTDTAQAAAAGKPMTWTVFPATPEGIEQVKQAGYTAISVCEFSHPIEEGKPKPLRYGDMMLDFDAKRDIVDASGTTVGTTGDIGKSLEAVRIFVRILTTKCDVVPDHLFYYASGGKGFHVVIPREIIGSGHGDVMLPEIYKHMLDSILNLVNDKRLWDGIVLDAIQHSRKLHPKDLCIDDNAFKRGKGQLMRLPHIQRTDGKYKVPVTYVEIVQKNAAYFEQIVQQDRHFENEGSRTHLACVKALETAFLRAKEFVSAVRRRATAQNSTAVMETECDFILFCREHPSDVDEPRWFMLGRILSHCGPMGNDLFHMYSSLDGRRYDAKETAAKLSNARQYPPVTCKEVNTLHPCTKNCRVKCPMDLYSTKIATSNDGGTFENCNGELYFYPDAADRTAYEKISSAVDIVASARDTESSSWSKIVELRDPDNTLHQCLVPFTALNGTGEDALDLLSEAGLRLEPGKRAKERLLYYLKSAHPAQRALIVDRNGWVCTTKKFFPFDRGTQLDGSDYLCARVPVVAEHFRQQGTLAEWQEHIGRHCLNNPLMKLACMTALSGPCLKILGHSGFTLHLYAHSSCGKTTNLHVGNSVTGGEILTWRMTDNGLESIAERHNDNCLLLDEISQAEPDVVAQAAYMLANGSGKTRSSKTGALRTTSKWLLVSLSTGEEPITDRIAQGFKNKAMAGHEVRMVSLLADGGTEQGIFSKVPENMSPGHFADMLVNNCKTYYGTPLLAMLSILKLLSDDLMSKSEGYSDTFFTKIPHEGLSSQAKRVANHFAFLACAGEYATYHKILPWPAGAAIEAAVFGFEAWRNDKGGSTDLEIEKAVDKLLKEARCDFYGRHGEGYPLSKWNHAGKDCYHIPRQYIVPEICKAYQYKKFVEALKARNMLVLTNDGEVREQIWSGNNSNRPRGISLIKERLYDYDGDEGTSTRREATRAAIIAQYTQHDDDDLLF